MPEIKRALAHPTERPITIAILAMGGEGGGVLADWLVHLAKLNGYQSQMTSVPGVAQRTGATIYYLELFKAQPGNADRPPILALMPAPGEVDIVIASELMEAGRAVQRGLVSKSLTTLIASTHRVYSMTEKTALGDGRVDSAQLMQAIDAAAQRLVSDDFAQMAREYSTVISAPLFGALAGSAALPFERATFEQTISSSGVGVATSLAAFGAAFQAAASLLGHAQPGASAQPEVSENERGQALAQLGPRLAHLVVAVQSEFDPAAHHILGHALLRLADYQDVAYAEDYLLRLRPIAEVDRQRGKGAGAQLLCETARHLALWMTYEDTIRVADLKTRAQRFTRVASEQGVQADQLLQIREFMHPRIEEIADTLPASWGRALLASVRLRAWLAPFTRNGRVIHSNSIRGYLMLYSLAGLRRWRRRTLRYSVEQGHIAIWLRSVEALAKLDYALAIEFAKTQRLVKGYGDTHQRGMSNYQKILAHLPGLGQREDAASRLRALTEAALADESGAKLSQALSNR
jgi:indolepyruvate ferredoxin oxidoreductase, beta subunit